MSKRDKVRYIITTNTVPRRPDTHTGSWLLGHPSELLEDYIWDENNPNQMGEINEYYFASKEDFITKVRAYAKTKNIGIKRKYLEQFLIGRESFRYDLKIVLSEMLDVTYEFLCNLAATYNRVFNARLEAIDSLKTIRMSSKNSIMVTDPKVHEVTITYLKSEL